MTGHIRNRRGLSGPRRGLLAALLLCWSMAYGYTVPLTAQQLTDRAELIVVGKVAEVTTSTQNVEAQINIVYVLKGASQPKSLRIRYPRGMSDVPTFTIGERLLLFLVRSDASSWQLVGGIQGRASLDSAAAPK